MPRFGKGRAGPQRAPYSVRQTTLLPASLREELIAAGSLKAPKRQRDGDVGMASTSVIGRKQRRKDERSAKKANTTSSSTSENIAKTAVKHVNSKQNKIAELSKAVRFSDNDGRRDQQIGTSSQKTEKELSKSKPTRLQVLLEQQQSGSKKLKNGVAVPRGPRSAVEEREDNEIAWYEAKLGIRTQGSGRTELEEDGLDDLFDDLDRLDDELFGSAAEDEALQYSNDYQPELDNEEESSSYESSANLGSEDEDQIMSETDDLQTFYTDEDQASVMDESLGKAALSTAPQSTGNYIPPALRKAAESAKALEEQPDDPQLRRQLRGLLNRLSSTSFPALVLNAGDANSLHGIYLGKSRAVVSHLLIRLICEVIEAQGEAGGIGDTQVFVLAGLAKILSTGIVGGLSLNGGKEFAASLLDHAIKRLDALATATDEIKGKRSLNLISFITACYNMQVYAASVIYDLVRERIARGLDESDAEQLLRILKLSGPQLRHDDPTALKAIISLVNDQQKTVPSAVVTPRQRFMLETLTNLRNNKIKPSTGPAAEAETGIKKYISSVARKSGTSSDALRLSLEDLRQSGSKGKWWLVGAAWAGNPLVEREAARASGDIESPTTTEQQSKDAALLKLARKQGMNTDVRRQVFVAIMGAEDYMDASDRVDRLKLTEIQQREVVRVLLHCLGNEKAYNPFYTLIMARLLTSSSTSLMHSYQITLQYALWDFFRELGESDVGGTEMARTSTSNEAVDPKRSRNTARAYAWWIAKAGLGLTILKSVPLGSMQRPSRKFLAAMLSALLLSTQTANPLLTHGPSTSRNVKTVKAPFVAVAAANPALGDAIGWFLENENALRQEKDDLTRWGIEQAVLALRAF